MNEFRLYVLIVSFACAATCLAAAPVPHEAAADTAKPAKTAVKFATHRIGTYRG